MHCGHTLGNASPASIHLNGPTTWLLTPVNLNSVVVAPLLLPVLPWLP